MNVRKGLAAIGIAGALLIPAAPALAQYPGSTPPSVQPTDTQSAQVKGTKHTRGIALTGADVLGIVGVGGVALAGGLVIRRAGRTRKSS
jgi:hypothetical protein